MPVCLASGESYKVTKPNPLLAEVYEDEHQLTDEYIQDYEYVVSSWYQCNKCGAWYDDEMHLLGAPPTPTIAGKDAHQKKTTVS